jgi:hypothetical protein
LSMRLLKRWPSKTPQKSNWWRGYNWGLWVKFIVLVLYVLFIFISPFINQEIKGRESERQRSVDVRAGRGLPFLLSRTKKRWFLKIGGWERVAKNEGGCNIATSIFVRTFGRQARRRVRP